MSGVTELLLKVTADPSGLQALATQFEATERRIVAAAQRSQAAIKGVGGGSGAAELTRMKSELDQVSAALRTQAAAQDILTQKVEDGSRRRSKASTDAAKSKMTEAEAAEEVSRVESRVTGMIISDQVKLAAERGRLAQARVAQDAKVASDNAAGEARATQMILESHFKLAAEMNRLRAKRIAEDAAASARGAAAEQATTLSLLNQQIAANARLSTSKTQVTSAAKAEADAYRDAHSAVRGLAGGVNMLWLTYGALLPLMAGFAVSAGIRKSIELGADFGYQLQFVGAVSGETGDRLKAAGGQFMQFAETSQFSSSEVARGARTLAQAGISLEDSVKMLPDLLKFSTLGEIELAQGAEIAAGTMHAFGLEVKDIPHILDSTAKAAQISQTTIGEMGQALRQASTVGLEFNVSLDQMNALLAVLAQRNIRGSAAGTALMNMMRELDPATKKAQDAFKRLNIEVVDGQGNYRNIITLLSEFSAKFSEFDQASQVRLARDYFNNRGAKAFLNAMKEANGELPKFLKQTTEADGTLNRLAGTIEQTFQVQGKEALHVFENSLIDAFQKSEPYLVDVLKQMRELAGDEGIKSGMSALIQLFGGLAAAVLAALAALAKIPSLPGVKPAGDVLAGAGMLISTGISDWRDYLSGAPDPTSAALGDDRSANSRRIQRLVDAMNRAETQRDLRTLRQMEVTTQQTVNTGYGNSASSVRGRVYDPMTEKDAERRAQDEVANTERLYRQTEQDTKAHLDAQMTMLRASHDARLMSDEAFNARSAQLADQSYQQDLARLTVYVQELQRRRATVPELKRNDIDTEIARARIEMAKRAEQIEVRSYQDLAKEIKKSTDIGFTEIEVIEKKNFATQSEIAALYSLNTAQKDSTIQTAEATIKKLELARATLAAKAATEDLDGSLTTEAQLAAAGVKTLDEQIDRLKKARDARIGLNKELKTAENSWAVGAVQGLQQYLDAGVSTAKAVGDAFKKGFSAMEAMLVSWVKTGKLNFKDFVNSIAEDILRMLIKLNITQPLARWAQNGISGQGWVPGFNSATGPAVRNADGTVDYTGSLLSGMGSIGTGAAWLGGATGLMTGTGAYAAGVYGLGATGAGSQAAMLAAQTGVFGAEGTAATVASGATIGGSGAGMLSGVYSALASIPVWGWIAMAVIAIGAWIAGSHKGGPKVGGSFMGSYDTSGAFTGNLAVPGTDNGRFFTPNQADPAMRDFGDSFARSYTEAVKRMGGTASAITPGFGIDHDPNGTARSRTSTSLAIGGHEVYNHRNVEMDDKEVPAALQLEAQRMLLAALQHSDLPAAVSKILNTLSAETASADAISGVYALAEAYQQLHTSLDPLVRGGLIEDAGRSQLDIARKQGEALVALSGKTTLSVESLGALRSATDQFRQSISQMILEFENAKHAIDDMFQNTARDIRLSVLDDQGKYNFYQTEAQGLYARAMTSNSASEIQRYATDINRDINAAYGLLSPEQQRAQSGDFSARAEMVNATLRARIDTLEQDAEATFNTAVDKMAVAVDKIVEDGTKAANLQLQAAQTPIQVDVGIDVEVFDSRAVATVVNGG